MFVFGQFMSNVRSLEVENLEVVEAGPDHHVWVFTDQGRARLFSREVSG